MPKHEGQHIPHVSTEPQRQALDEMSRQLVEKLNAMVHEQHERARRFAATQHSLSPLPGTAPLPPQPKKPNFHFLSEKPEPLPPLPNAPVAEAKKVHMPFSAHVNAQPKKPQEFKPLGDLPRQVRSATPKTEQKSESGCGTVPTVIFIIILIIILRSCS